MRTLATRVALGVTAKQATKALKVFVSKFSIAKFRSQIHVLKVNTKTHFGSQKLTFVIHFSFCFARHRKDEKSQAAEWVLGLQA